MLDLFDTPILPGLRSTDAFVCEKEATALIAAIDAARLSPFRFQGWVGRRLTRSFGWHYDFDTGSFAAVEPIPAWLKPLRLRAEDFAGLERGSLVQALVIRYDIGAGIGWHRDRPHFEHVVGISLGAPAIMRFRQRIGQRSERANVALEPGGAYHLSGVARHDWEHSIAEMIAKRWSITFRSLSDKGRQLLASADADAGNPQQKPHIHQALERSEEANHGRRLDTRRRGAGPDRRHGDGRGPGRARHDAQRE